MFLLLSWNVGEVPFLEPLPTDLKEAIKIIANAFANRTNVQLWSVGDNTLVKLYPDEATSGSVGEVELVPK